MYTNFVTPPASTRPTTLDGSGGGGVQSQPPPPHRPFETYSDLVNRTFARFKINFEPRLIGQFDVNNETHFEYEVGGWKSIAGRGRARAIKAAKHLAARQFLLNVIEAGYWEELQLPGNTAQEARDYILGLMPSLASADSTNGGAATAATADANPVGTLVAICQRNRLGVPDYEFSETGSDNARIFTATCRIKRMGRDSIERSAEGRTKKAAKADAARAMLDFVRVELADVSKRKSPIEASTAEEAPHGERTASPEDDDLGGGGDPANATGQLETDVSEISLISGADIERELERRLRDLRNVRWTDERLDYLSLDEKMAPRGGGGGRGAEPLHCVLLRLNLRPASDDSPSLHVFPGAGESYAVAQQNAARAALSLFVSTLS